MKKQKENQEQYILDPWNLIEVEIKNNQTEELLMEEERENEILNINLNFCGNCGSEKAGNDTCE